LSKRPQQYRKMNDGFDSHVVLPYLVYALESYDVLSASSYIL
jgi:hypothetical protein